MTAPLKNFEASEQQIAEASGISARLADLIEAVESLSKLMPSLTDALERFADEMERNWFAFGLEWQLRFAHDAAEWSNNFKVIGDDQLKLLSPEFVKVYKKALARYQKAIMRFRSVVESKRDLERRATEALKGSPETIAQDLETHFKALKEIEEGRSTVYSLEEYDKEFG
jgi:hypothetical protein